jgi:hypothetical protein
MMIDRHPTPKGDANLPEYPVSDTAMRLFRESEERIKTEIDKVYAQYARGLLTSNEFFAKCDDIRREGA